MIQGITGKVGGGKSLLALTMMLRDFCKGCGVATNIELNLDAVALYCWKQGHKFRPSQYKLLDMENVRFHEQIKRGAVGYTYKVYLDEAHLFFSADDHRSMAREFEDVKKFVSQSRKVYVDIFLITQAWENLWGQFRRHAEFIYKCRDFRNIKFGIFGTLPGLALKWSRCEAQTDLVMETGSTSISRIITDCYSTAQVYDPMMRALVDSIPAHEIVTDKVGLFSRLFLSPPKAPCESSSS